jgi:glutamine amidotransferase
MIAVIDYGAGNIGSVNNAITKLGFNAIITNKPDVVLNAKAVILPGVGSAGDTMESLKSIGMIETIGEIISMKRPLFAICVGLQVLLTSTEEGGGHKCMDILQGTVRHLPPGQKIPHIGWNQVKQRFAHPIFKDIPDESNFYFVHSYYADPVDNSIVAGTTQYGTEICSIIVRDNLIATQFHPEKSSIYGLKMYSNFFELARIEKT